MPLTGHTQPASSKLLFPSLPHVFWLKSWFYSHRRLIVQLSSANTWHWRVCWDGGADEVPRQAQGLLRNVPLHKISQRESISLYESTTTTSVRVYEANKLHSFYNNITIIGVILDIGLCHNFASTNWKHTCKYSLRLKCSIPLDLAWKILPYPS